MFCCHLNEGKTQRNPNPGFVNPSYSLALSSNPNTTWIVEKATQILFKVKNINNQIGTQDVGHKTESLGGKTHHFFVETS
jgi:hypothetical protein